MERSYSNARMANSFMYWNDCVDPDDLEAMWMDPAVRAEWIEVGETKGQKVHLSRDPDGQPYLTQTEMKVINHFLKIVVCLAGNFIWFSSGFKHSLLLAGCC